MAKCANCGGNTEPEHRFCAYCGAEVERPNEHHVYVHHLVEEKTADPDQRLEEAEHFPDLAALMAYTPTRLALTGMGVAQGGFGCVFTLVSAFMLTMFLQHAPTPVALVPGLFVLVGLGLTVSGLTLAAKGAAGGVQRRLAIVHGESAETHRSENHSSTSHYTALRFRGGDVRTYRTQAKTSAAIREGDLGVAYLSGDWLVDFRHLTS